VVSPPRWQVVALQECICFKAARQAIHAHLGEWAAWTMWGEALDGVLRPLCVAGRRGEGVPDPARGDP
jgi:hypothetical protein